jgi:pimeloyl-ACP methyl ester carboxylesterase
MGGAIAFDVARLGAARTVTAISPAGFGSRPERVVATTELGLLAFTPERIKPWAWRFAGTRPGGVALLGVVHSKSWRTPPEERRATLADAWASPSIGGALKMLRDYEFPGATGLPDIPLTVAWGSRDFLLPYALQAPRARRALPRAAHVTLKGAGHTPFYDDPDATANVIAATAGRLESAVSRSTTTSSSAPARQAVPSRRG